MEKLGTLNLLLSGIPNIDRNSKPLICRSTEGFIEYHGHTELPTRQYWKKWGSDENG
jgi:hypothetical protein